MQQGIYEILENREIAEDVCQLRLKTEENLDIRCGQFVNVKIDSLFLRRPISVADYDRGILTLIYKVVGEGTRLLSEKREGKLDLLTGLGNGYDLSLSTEKPLLIGGGVGVPPLYYLAKEFVKEGREVGVVLGFNKKEEIFYEEEFRALGCKVCVTTADGSYGIRGFVTDALKEMDYSYFYTCGPLPMLKAVCKSTAFSGQISLEERMGCGFGACMGCSVKVKGGYKRICKEGPVFKKEELLWED